MTGTGEVPTRLSPDVGAGAVVHQRLSLQVAELHRQEHEIRVGDTQEGVHDARVAGRRVRAALASFGPLLHAEVAEAVREDLRWLGRVLGEARDPHVAQERLRELLAAEPADELAGPVQRRLDTTYAARIAEGEERLDRALSSPRHVALVAELDRLVADPPWTGTATLPASEVLPGLVRQDWKRLRSRMDAVPQGADRDEALHDARKAARRLRYSAEAMRPVWGEDARELGRAARALSEHLGDRQDLLLVRADLVAMADAAEEAGEPSRTWGALMGRADERRQLLDLRSGRAVGGHRAGLAEPPTVTAVSGPAKRSTC